MPIIKKNEAMPQRPVVILLYGVPGCGKSSLASTSNNPLLIDCDRGADRAVVRPDVLTCSSWEDITNELGTMKGYSTIIIDTAKACLDDFMIAWAIRTDDAAKKNALKAYGLIGKEFSQFVANIRAMGKDLVIIAHAKEDKDGDDRIFFPDVTGQSRDLVQRIADQIGFLSYGGDNSRVLHFRKDRRIVAKDTACLGDIIIPESTDPSYASAMTNIIAEVKKRIQERTNAQNAALDAIKVAEDAIAQVIDGPTADAALAAINACPQADITPLKKKLQPTLKRLNLKMDKASGKFVAAE